MSTVLIRPRAVLDIDGDDYAVETGNAKLDAGAVPYARATVSIPFVDDTTLEWLDPRDGVRCPFDAGDADGSTRPFDLGLRSRTIDHTAKTVTLDLASDEALLQDYAVLTLDKGARAYESSARAVTDYVLGKIGASLEAGTDNADLTAYWPLTNLHPNPGPVSVTTGYGAGTGASALTMVLFGSVPALRWTVGTGTSILIAAPSLTAFRAVPGRTYTFATYIRSSNVRTAQAAIQWRNVGSASALATVYGSSVSTSTGGWTRITVTATAPAGAEFLYPLAVTYSNVSGQFHYVYWTMIYEGDELVTYFDGATADTSAYQYDWADPTAANASSSTRTPLLVERPPSLFSWQPGTSAWDFLMPLLASVNLVLWCDEQRQWFLSTPEKRTLPGLVSISAFNVERGTDTLSRDDPDAFSTGIVIRYSWTDDDDVARTATDSAGTPDKVYVLDLNNTPFPGAGVAAAMLARRQGTGRVQDVDAITTWSTTPGQTAQVTLPGAPDTYGRVAAVDFDLQLGFMRVETSGLVDIVPGSIASLVGPISGLVGPISGL